MGSAAIDYGRGPERDEWELSIFGPGYGEALAMHVGNGDWILVDSCIDKAAKKPASLHYLTKIHVPSEAVRLIVASHWHDDHVRGLAALLDFYSKAELAISDVFDDRESLGFLTAYSGAAAPDQTGGTKELFQALKQRATVLWSAQRTVLFERRVGALKVRLSAFSPTMNAKSQFKARYASFVPSASKQPINHAPQLHTNIESVVLHVDLGGDAILLGSDMMLHHRCGWEAILSDAFCTTQQRASAYKVAHHGSETGDHPDIWAKLLSPQPAALLSPFIKGNVRLPTDSDAKRIRKHTKSAFISSGASRKAEIRSDVLRRMKHVCPDISVLNPGFGAVRLRKRPQETAWRAELFGDAQKI